VTQKQLERYLAGLWEKYGHADKHGYKDWMSQEGFNGAVREALQKLGATERTT
jgi:hypothetical protein